MGRTTDRAGRVLLVAAKLVPLASPVADDFARAAAARDPGIWQYSILLYTGWSGRWAGVGLALILGTFFDLCRAYPWLLTGIQLTLIFAIYDLLSAAFAEKLARSTARGADSRFRGVALGRQSLSLRCLLLDDRALENHMSLSMGMVILAGSICAGRRCARLARHWRGGPAGHCHARNARTLWHLPVRISRSRNDCGLLDQQPGPASLGAITFLALVGLAVNLASPGHARRLGYNAPRHDLARLAEVARQWRLTAVAWGTDLKLLLATLLIVCHPRAADVCPEWLQRRRGWWIAGGVIGVVGLIASAAVVNWWTFSTAMPGRTRSALYLLFLALWFLTAYGIGTAPVFAARVSRPVWACLACCCAFALTAGANYHDAQVDLVSGRAARLHAAVIDRDRLLRMAVGHGDVDPLVPAYPPMANCLMSADIVAQPAGNPQGWLNTAFCKYYGLTSIGLRPAMESANGGPGGR